MTNYILMTKFYNERESIPTLVENISNQTLRPMMIVFVDDGSIDGSGDIAADEAKKHGIDYRLVSMPQKRKGNLDTLGRAWSKAQPLLKTLSKDVPYFAATDVDTLFEPTYFKDMISYLQLNPSVGVIAGQALNEPTRTFPMFAGKVFRSRIIQSIDRYWDISIDSFINVKALKLGYEVRVLDHMIINTPKTHLLTKKGRLRAGRLAYYSGVSFQFVLLKAIIKHDAHYLRGYWFEFSSGKWRCDDPDILQYFGNEFIRKIFSVVGKILGLKFIIF